MVKKLSIITILFSVAILVTSCGSYLDINNQEKQSPEIYSEKADLEVYYSLKNNEMVSVIVKLRDNYNPDDLQASKIKISENQNSVLNTLTEEEFSLKYKYKTVNAFSGQVSQEGLDKLINNENVENIYYDVIFHTLLAESILQIHANSAWSLKNYSGANITGSGSTVCILDSGVDYTHPDLAGNYVGGYDFVNNDGNPMDDNGHGTQMAGVIASAGPINGGYSYQGGVAKGANFAAVKVCNQNVGCYATNIMAGIDWCLDHANDYNIKVISMSLGEGGGYLRTTCPTTIDSSIETAVNNYKIPMVAASGNDGNKNGIFYPACNNNVIAVGATYDRTFGTATWTNASCTDSGSNSQNDSIGCGSSSSEDLDLVAPGFLIKSTTLTSDPDGYSNPLYGTSFSTAHVAGTIALMKQMNPNPDLDPEKIISILKSTGVPKVDPGNGLTFPRIDVYQAVLASKPINNPGSSPLIIKVKPKNTQQQI